MYHAKNIKVKNQAPKSNVIYTPDQLAGQIANLVGKHSVVFDPAVGGGALIKPMRVMGLCHHVIGIDINKHAEGFRFCNETGVCDFTKLEYWPFKMPDIVIMNPPFNGAESRQLYPELFLRKCFEFFGYDIPVVMATPVGFRSNLRSFTSKRLEFLRDCNITSIMTVPATIYPSACIQTEILFFNLPKLPPHMVVDLTDFQQAA
ncbi:hypothetical protein GCM10011332_32920 [Terasakiella brassicae]|uniref:Uncharacterized protein n=1 Tax=Terasakiella brassicae TaxID=1634917 RepID=A0A917C8G4_9PROT|nr:class I SAM-dependent methyltransferase [Terasakiella brassicae]GGF76362.1 hypothetical protein GCM10011332_32920 [Terasakiella brassicae]